MLLGFAAIFAATGSFDFQVLATAAADGSLTTKLASLGHFWPQVVFLGVLLGFAVKVPLYPFHTWLPPAYAEAPTGVAMFLTGVMSKMGVYGFLRILWPIVPAQLHAAATPLLWLALGGVVLGAFAALRQTDLKRMVAYSSVNHLSYCLLALFAIAAGSSDTSTTSGIAAVSSFNGIALQMINHGLSAAALFFCVGVLEERSGRQTQPRRLRRRTHRDAGLRRLLWDRLVLLARSARAQRLRRRVSPLPRHLQFYAVGRRHRHPRSADYRALPPDFLATRLSRPAGSGRRAVP